MKDATPQKILVFLLAILFLEGCGRNEKLSTDLKEIVDGKIIIGDVDWREVSDLDDDHPIRKAASPVGDIDLPELGSRCTGFLISKNVVLTNQHCVPSASYARGVTVAFRHEKDVSKYEWETFKCDKFIGNNKTLDFALLECVGSPGKEFGTVKLSSESVSVGEEVFVVQQNCDYYLSRNCDWTKKYSFGKITEIEKELAHNADTLGGSSGSPVFSENTYKVVGLHHAGLGNNGYGRGIKNFAVPMNKVVSYIKRNFPSVLKSGASQNQTFFGEPNDTKSEAYKLTKNDLKVSASIQSAGDEDFYAFSLNSDGDISIKVDFVHAKGDLDLYLYNEYGKAVGKSNGTKDLEKIAKYLTKGKYFIKVYGYRSSTGDYQMSFKAQTSSGDVEPNNSLKTASPLKVGATIKGEISNSKDVDVYKISLTISQFLKVSLTMKNKSEDLDLYIVNEDAEIISKSATLSRFEKVGTSLNSGEYYIVVVGYNGVSGNYSLEIE